MLGISLFVFMTSYKVFNRIFNKLLACRSFVFFSFGYLITSNRGKPPNTNKFYFAELFIATQALLKKYFTKHR